ncbi:MAG: Verru_Chthon cassette protein D [Candidatus Methylacidiphilales bacterium]|nr:Verru_Chthon cassette protein D [Candidatus Methylacidiphilales bacterium]
MKPNPQARAAAFSLIELLVVLAIIAIIVPLSVPAVSSIQRGLGITSGGQMLSDAFVTARQEASVKNRSVEVRIIQTGTPPSFRALQNWIADDRGTMSPLGKVVILPKGTVISSNTSLSPLLAAYPGNATATFGALGNCSYSVLRIRAGGQPDPSITSNNNFVTVHATTDTAIPPVNYFTVRLNPVTGRVTLFRP